MLADSWDASKTQAGNWEVFEQISLAIWSELAEPGARGEHDFEAELFWKNLCSMIPSFAEQVLLFLEQKRYDVQSANKSRRRYREACNIIFQRSYEAEIISPLTERFRNPEFFKDL